MCVGEGRFQKITKRVSRLFSRKKPEAEKPRKLSASQVIEPEKVVPPTGKTAPTRRYEHLERPTDCGATITELPWGITHICFMREVAMPPPPDDTVTVRDPVTRRLSRRKLRDGMRRTTGFYDESGALYDETNTNW